MVKTAGMIALNLIYLTILVIAPNTSKKIRNVYNLMLIKESSYIDIIDYWNATLNISDASVDREMQTLSSLIQEGNFRSSKIDTWNTDTPDEVAMLFLNVFGDVHAWLAFNTSRSASKGIQTWMTADRLVDSSFNNSKSLQVNITWKHSNLTIHPFTYSTKAWLSISSQLPHLLLPSNLSMPFSMEVASTSTKIKQSEEVAEFTYPITNTIQIDIVKQKQTGVHIHEMMVTHSRYPWSTATMTLEYSLDPCSDQHRIVYNDTDSTLPKVFNTQESSSVNIHGCVRCVWITFLSPFSNNGNISFSNDTEELVFDFSHPKIQTIELDVVEEVGPDPTLISQIETSHYSPENVTMTLEYSIDLCYYNRKTVYRNLTTNSEEVFKANTTISIELLRIRCLWIILSRSLTYFNVTLYQPISEFVAMPVVAFKGFWYTEPLQHGDSMAKYHLNTTYDMSSDNNSLHSSMKQTETTETETAPLTTLQLILQTTARVNDDYIATAPTKSSTISATKCTCCSIGTQRDVPDLEMRLQELHTALAIDKKSLSSYKRLRQSAKDDRPSAICIGYFGGLVLFLCAFVIFLSDVVSFFKYLYTKYRQKQK